MEGGFENTGGCWNSKDSSAYALLRWRICFHLIDPTDQVTRLYIADTKALNHVLVNSYDYQKSDATRYDLSRMVGTGTYDLPQVPLYYLLKWHWKLGLLVVEGDEHKHQVPSSYDDRGIYLIRENSVAEEGHGKHSVCRSHALLLINSESCVWSCAYSWTHRDFHSEGHPGRSLIESRSLVLYLLRQVARYLATRELEARKFSSHRCPFLAQQDDVGCHWSSRCVRHSDFDCWLTSFRVQL